MKKTFILTCLMSLTGLSASADTVLWEGVKTVNYNYSSELSFDASLFANTHERDMLVFSVTPSASWGCNIVLADKTGSTKYYDSTNGILGKTLNPGGPESVAKDYYLPISVDFLTQLQANGLSLIGGKYDLTKLIIKENPASANADTQVSGKTINWWNSNLSDIPFTCAAVGDILAVTVSAVNEGKTGEVLVQSKVDGSKDLQRQGNITGACVVKFVMDQEMVDAAKAGKLCVQGHDYTYTSIDLVYAPIVNISASAEYATFSFNEKLDLTGIEAYAVSEVGEKATLASLTDKKIAANTGIILYKGGGGLVRIPFTAGDTDNITNSLTGTADGPVTATGSQFVLADGAKGVGFYKIKSGETIAQNKAYLTLGATAREFIGFLDQETTNVEELSSKTTKEAGDIFDLQGRRVSAPVKGLYIINNKKVIIK